MENVLTKLGLTKKEAKFYSLLLNTRLKTPAELAKETGETRVNAYALLDSLVEKELVSRKELNKKFIYKAENPTRLKEMLLDKQNALTETQNQLQTVLPHLLTSYRIVQNKPGVLYLQGVKNLKTVYDDILRVKSDLSIFPSREKRKIAGLNEFVEERIKLQKKAGVKTRALYHEHTRSMINVKELYRKGVAVKFWHAEPYEAQIIIYGDNVVINTFTDTVYTTVITDSIIAKTMRVIFNEAWKNAKN